jgi:hypothetical protein
MLCLCDDVILKLLVQARSIPSARHIARSYSSASHTAPGQDGVVGYGCSRSSTCCSPALLRYGPKARRTGCTAVALIGDHLPALECLQAAHHVTLCDLKALGQCVCFHTPIELGQGREDTVVQLGSLGGCQHLSFISAKSSKGAHRRMCYYSTQTRENVNAPWAWERESRRARRCR